MHFVNERELRVKFLMVNYFPFLISLQRDSFLFRISYKGKMSRASLNQLIYVVYQLNHSMFDFHNHTKQG